MTPKEKAKDYRLKRYYGITLQDYDNLRAEQDNACYICQRPETDFTRPLVVDHCHSTGRVRGLLCNWCNRGLSYFRDDATALARASCHVLRDHGFIVPLEYLKGVKKKRRRKKKNG